MISLRNPQPLARAGATAGAAGAAEAPTRRADAPRLGLRVLLVFLDPLILLGAAAAAYWIRFDGEIESAMQAQMSVMVPGLTLARMVACCLCGVYADRGMALSSRDLLRIGSATLLVSALLLIDRLLFPSETSIHNLPLGIIVLEGTLAGAGLIASRLLLSLATEPHGRALRTATGSNGEFRSSDLLGRNPMPSSISLEDLLREYRGKRVIVTGAGGSVGSELCRQLLQLEPGRLVLIERDENNLFEIEHELRRNDAGRAIVAMLADVTDTAQLERIFLEHEPQIVFHAAAYKHVPVMERFPVAAVENNVFGTRTLAALAGRLGVERFVMVSTDKAVNPSSVMGATKRLAEVVVQREARASATHFSCVRFGNVLDSRGSAVRIFREQVQRGGPLTVTHALATRYFMTASEAVALVIQAALLGRAGEIFHLDLGHPVRILDLARRMIRLSGFTEAEVPIEIVGSRPGEKVFEEFRAAGEDIERTALPGLLRYRPARLDDASIDRGLARLERQIRGQEGEAVRETLLAMGIGYAPPDGDSAGGRAA
jgi:FlaA1/EpsC-like NDP-sugar epimerase